MRKDIVNVLFVLFGLIVFVAAAPSRAIAQQPTAEQPGDPARSLFLAGRNAWDEGRYAEAEKRFREVLSKFPKSEQADRTGFYLIETLSRMGRSREALAEIDNFFKNYPKSRWFADVQEKRIGLTGQWPPNMGFYGDGRGNWDAGLALEALRALLTSDEARGIGVMRERMKNDPTDPVVLASLSQLAGAASSNALSFLISVAKTGPNPKARSNAAFWLGRVSSDKDGLAVKALADISRSDSDISVRQAAIQALTPHKEPEALKAIEDFLKNTARE